MLHNQYQLLPTNKNSIITSNPDQLLSFIITSTSTTTMTNNLVADTEPVIQVPTVRAFHSRVIVTSITRASTMGSSAPKRGNFPLIIIWVVFS
jgi:hypothetical protein